jgi:hypothetical protein
VGIREDYSFQADCCANLDLPIHILDNDFHNPDVERWIGRCREVEPTIGIVGDAYSVSEAREYVAEARKLRREFPTMDIVIVPKAPECFAVIPDWVILGYPEGGGTGDGQSNIHPTEYSEIGDWRGRRVHILGGSPPRQWEAIQRLTRRTLGADQPANIVGCDYNGQYGAAIQYGSFWTREGWQNSADGCDHWETYKHEWARADIIDEAMLETGPEALGIDEKVRIGLYEGRVFLRKRGVWPGTTPDELDTWSQADPSISVFAEDGTEFGMDGLDHLYPPPHSLDPDSRSTQAHSEGAEGSLQMATEGSEPVVLVEFEDGHTLTYRDSKALDFDLHRGGLLDRHGEPERVVNGHDGTVTEDWFC